MNEQKPKIACLPNGPYYLLEDMEPKPVAHLRRQSGEPCATAHGVALCRCGGSSNKPFCDGTHARNGFNDRKMSDGAQDMRRSYVGKRITVFDNRALCSHAGFCTDRLKTVFRQHEEPWIDADGAAVEEIVSAVERCPSGALSYAIEGEARKEAEQAPMVTVTDNGPYAITGGIELIGGGASAEHYTLCRCGSSRNKPFCDGSHWQVGFRDL